MPRLIAVVVATLLAISGAAHGSEPENVLNTKDPRGDVRMYPAKVLSSSARQSIDLNGFTLQRDDRRLRAVFSIARVITSPGWDQMFFVTMKPPRTSTDTWLATFGATTKGRAYGTWAADSDYSTYRYCPASARVRWAKAELVVDVPWRCIPTGPTRMHVKGSTGYFETDAPPFSRDILRVPGSVTLQN